MEGEFFITTTINYFEKIHKEMAAGLYIFLQ